VEKLKGGKVGKLLLKHFSVALGASW